MTAPGEIGHCCPDCLMALPRAVSIWHSQTRGSGRIGVDDICRLRSNIGISANFIPLCELAHWDTQRRDTITGFGAVMPARVVKGAKGSVVRRLEDLMVKLNETSDKVVHLELGEVKVPEIDFVEYQPGLRKNVQIHLLFDNTKDDPNGSDAAIIRYLPGAVVPRHLHMGFEMVLVLQGEYVENGLPYGPGSLIIRAPGTTHEMRSGPGCTILAMRDVPVKQLT
jgi:hypothetical protein